MATRPYDDQVSADDEKLLKDFMEQKDEGSAPVAEGEDGPEAEPGADIIAAEIEAGLRNADGSPIEKKAEPAKDEPKAEEKPKEEEEKDDPELAAFMEKHKGKSPEEISRLLWQQQKRAAGAEARARKSKDELTVMLTGAADRRKTQLASIAQRRASLAEDLEKDPDKVAREMAEARLDEEERAADQAEHAVRVEVALELAEQAVPDFAEKHAANAFRFGRAMGYTTQELAGISDGRDLINLHLAGIAGRMIMAGIIDQAGNILAGPKPVEEEKDLTDPRLTGKEPITTLSSAPARSGEGGKTKVQLMQDALAMSDRDFDALPESEIVRITS